MNLGALPYLLRYHRRSRWKPTLWLLSAGLISDFVLQKLSAPENFRIGAALLFVLGIVIQHLFRKNSIHQTAQKLDRKLSASNRFEAIAESLSREDAFAHALRAEASRFLSQQPLPSAWSWWLSILVLIFICGVQGVDVFLRREPAPLAVAPSQSPPLASSVSAMASSPEVSPVNQLDASDAYVEWHHPQGTQKSFSGDLVPFQAALTSQKESYDLFLKIEINGVAHSLEKIASHLPPGERWVDGQLDLSVLPVRPFDVVSYSLRAVPLSGAAIDETRGQTPPQWIQIRERQEILPDRLLDGALANRLNTLREAQRAHLALQAALAPPDKSRLTPEIARTLSQQQHSLASLLDQHAASSQGQEPDRSIGAAAAATRSAAQYLEAGDFSATRQSSLQAIAALAAAERRATDALRTHRDGVLRDTEQRSIESLPSLADRENTIVVGLESVAARQTQLAHALNQPAPSTSQLFLEQSNVLRDLESLRSRASEAPKMQELIASALAAAKEAQRQLNEGDSFAALEPASQAARQLQEALSAQKTESFARAEDTLRLTQEALNRSANDVRQIAQDSLGDQTRTASARIQRLRENLQAEARHQQEYGSATTASTLRDLEEKIARADFERQVRALLNSPTEASSSAREDLAQRFEAFAQESAQAQQTLSDPEAIQQQALETLAALRRELPQAAQDGSAHVRELHEKTLAEEQRLAATTGRSPQTVPPPAFSSGGSPTELTWIRPTDHLSVTPKQIVKLVARGHRSRVYSDFRLRLSISGNPPSDVSFEPASSAANNLFESDLLLASLQLQPGDFVSYTLHARSTGSVTNQTDAGVPRDVSSAAQFLYLPKGDEPILPAKEIKRGVLVPSSTKEDVYSQQRRLFQDTAHSQHRISIENTPIVSSLEPASLAQRQRKIRADAIREILENEHDEERRRIWTDIFGFMALARRQLNERALTEAMTSQHQALVLMAPLFRETQRQEFAPQADSSRQKSSPTSAPSLRLGQSPSSAPAPISPTESSRPRSGSTQQDQPSHAHVRTTRPPPPGRGPALAKLYEYTTQLAPRVSGLIQETQATHAAVTRTHLLRSSSTREAPPAYQPAVSLYFEALASEGKPKSAPPPSR